MTRPLEPGDGRLKVLWLDDTIDRIAPWEGEARDYEPWFSLVYASHPAEVRELVEASEYDGLERARLGKLYDAPGMPFDAYLVDFRMCDSIDEGCSIQAHIDDGLHAPSAGFLVGMLTALRWPKHPQAIIPYSGYDEEFGQIWRLSSYFCPPAISVLWDDSVTKGSRSQRALLRLLPRQCRAAILASTEHGAVCVPLKERDRWSAMLEEGGGAPIPAEERIHTTGEYGARPYLIGALFHDHLDEESGTVSAKPVAGWLSKLPVTDPIEPEARRLAEFYWKMRRSEASEYIHEFARALKEGKRIEGLPEDPPSFPWLCSWKEKGPSKDDSIRRIRLALLFLILREHEHRVRRRHGQKGISEACRRLLSLISYDVESMEDLLEALRHEAWAAGYADRYHDLIAEFLQVMRDRPSIPLSGVAQDWDLDVSEADVVRLVDPFPQSWDVRPSLDNASKLGKGLSRLDVGDIPSLDVKALLIGDGSSLTPSELMCARRFAREMPLSETEWPRWLRGGE
jgi:hypothetical protein